MAVTYVTVSNGQKVDNIVLRGQFSTLIRVVTSVFAHSAGIRPYLSKSTIACENVGTFSP